MYLLFAIIHCLLIGRLAKLFRHNDMPKYATLFNLTGMTLLGASLMGAPDWALLTLWLLTWAVFFHGMRTLRAHGRL